MLSVWRDGRKIFWNERIASKFPVDAVKHLIYNQAKLNAGTQKRRSDSNCLFSLIGYLGLNDIWRRKQVDVKGAAQSCITN